MYFTLDLLFHLETNKMISKLLINFCKALVINFFLTIKPFSKYMKLAVIIQIKLLLTMMKLSLMLFTHCYVMLPIYPLSCNVAYYYVLSLKRQVLVNQKKQLFLFQSDSVCKHKTEIS